MKRASGWELSLQASILARGLMLSSRFLIAVCPLQSALLRHRASLSIWASSAVTMLGGHLFNQAMGCVISVCALSTVLTLISWAGKNIVLIDDSIVRGTTSHKIVALMRLFGAHEVHMRIASPPIAYACHLGIDTPHIDNLLAHRHNLEEMKQFLDVDSLGFLSVESLYRALGSHPRESGKRYLCDACFTGDYPVVAHREDKV